MTRAAACLAALFWAGPAHALSLRSTRAEAFLGEVRPGGKASFASAAGASLGVENTGTEAATVAVSLSIPPPERLEDGFEALPDPRWVRLSGESHTLDPGRSGATDIVVTVPRDAGLEGRQFVFDARIQGRNAAGSGLTLTTTVRFAVGDGDPPDCREEPPDSGFSLSPRTLESESPPGKRRVKVKLVNAGERELLVRLSPLREWPPGKSPPRAGKPRRTRAGCGRDRRRKSRLGPSRARSWSCPCRARRRTRRALVPAHRFDGGRTMTGTRRTNA